MTQIDETIASYLTALKIEGKTATTIASYANSLEDFRRVGRRLSLPERVEEFAVEHVYEFLGAMQERGASPDYRHRRHREVQTLFSWCERMGLVDENVFKRVPRVKVGEKIKPPFAPEEVRLLLGSQDRERLGGCRNYAIILFLLDTGVRASECISIRLEDVDWERQRVFVRHANGQKQRWVGLGEIAASALRDYVDRSRGERRGMLFLSGYGEPLTTGNSLRIILRRIGDGVGCYIIGDRVAGGLYGEYPSLKQEDWLYGEDLQHTIDFRSVYSTVLEQWLSVDAIPIVGGSYEQINPYTATAEAAR